MLADVAGFENAHRLALHSIEVLNRNGGHPARMPHMAIVKPIASGLVSVLLGFIIRNYRNTLTRDIRRLYERRFAVAASGSLERALLPRARNDITVIDDGFASGAAGVPAFLVGGAVLSTVFASIESTLLAIFHTPIGVSVVSVIAVLLLILLAWSAMYAAAVARRRIRLSTQLPARGLWDAVGFCGDPPKDQSFLFAVIAIVLAVLAWVLVPVVAYANLLVNAGADVVHHQPCWRSEQRRRSTGRTSGLTALSSSSRAGGSSGSSPWASRCPTVSRSSTPPARCCQV